MRLRFRRLSGLLALLLLAVAALSTFTAAMAADLKGGRLRVAILRDMTNFDPQQFSTVNFPLIKNFYDSLLEYTPDGKAVPSLASSWEIAPDNKSVTVKLRTVVDPQTIRLNFTGPAPERQVTDLLQFLAIIDPAGIDTIEQKPAGTGAYTLGERV